MSKKDWYQEYLAEEKRQRQQMAATKALVCDALRARGIATVTIDYDGEGDSGQISEISPLDDEGKTVKLDASVALALHDPEKPTNYTSLSDALDDFAWTILQAWHGGFENNEGGYGAITIDATNGTVTIDHNDRVIDVDNTVTEV